MVRKYKVAKTEVGVMAGFKPACKIFCQRQKIQTSTYVFIYSFTEQPAAQRYFDKAYHPALRFSETSV